MNTSSSKQGDTGKRLMCAVLPVAEKQVTCERYSFFGGNTNQVSRFTAALAHDTLESCRTRSSETTSPAHWHLHIRFINPYSTLNITR